MKPHKSNQLHLGDFKCLVAGGPRVGAWVNETLPLEPPKWGPMWRWEDGVTAAEAMRFLISHPRLKALMGWIWLNCDWIYPETLNIKDFKGNNLDSSSKYKTQPHIASVHKTIVSESSTWRGSSLGSGWNLAMGSNMGYHFMHKFGYF